MKQDNFDDSDFWKGIILFGLNAATYKMALAKTLLQFSLQGKQCIDWYDLSAAYLDNYCQRLAATSRPQQSNPSRITFMERVVKELQLNNISYEQAVSRVAEKGFVDVVPRFHTIGTNKELACNKFYEAVPGKQISLKDSILGFGAEEVGRLQQEIDARWSLLEGAFTINQSQFELANDIRDIYIQHGYDRKPITQNIPFLMGYQGNTCFYCGEELGSDIHVDHVLPRQVVCHDEVWNLVLAHDSCNLLKSDKLVGAHFLEKLVRRNENIMGSNHPWKKKIAQALGSTPAKRSRALTSHYDNVKTVLGRNYWGGAESYNPATDPFFRRLITLLNNS